MAGTAKTMSLSDRAPNSLRSDSSSSVFPVLFPKKPCRINRRGEEASAGKLGVKLAIVDKNWTEADPLARLQPFQLLLKQIVTREPICPTNMEDSFWDVNEIIIAFHVPKIKSATFVKFKNVIFHVLRDDWKKA